MKFWMIISIIALSFFSLKSQNETTSDNRPVDVSFEFQMYPAGIMPGLRAEIGVGKYYKHSVETRIAYNRARRHSWGEHGDERGGGWGGSLGYRYYIIKPMNGLFVGARTDIWKLTIDYRNIGPDEIYDTIDDSDFGQSKILILQPTAAIGYKFTFPVGENKTIIFITPQVAAGWEYNAKTSPGNVGALDGEAVGQGAIGLWGVDIGVRF